MTTDTNTQNVNGTTELNPFAGFDLEIPGETIIPEAKRLADEEKSAVKTIVGLSVSDGFFANGTKMLGSGEEKAKSLRKEYDKLPTVEEGLGTYIDVIREEKRLDLGGSVKKCYVDRDGVFQGLESAPEGLVFSQEAYRQIASNFAPKSIPAGLKTNLNLWLHSTSQVLNFRTRYPQGEELIDEGGKPLQTSRRQVFAVVSPKYTRFDSDAIAAELIRVCPKNAKAEWMYDGSDVELIVSLAPVYGEKELGVGRLSRLKLIINTDDEGRSKLRASFAVEHIACINCTRLTDKRFILERKHAGINFRAFVQEAMGKGIEALKFFSERWKAAEETHFIDKASKGEITVEETFRRLVSHGHINFPWANKPTTVAMLMDAWKLEEGTSAAHINAAITRMAHMNAGEWKSPWYTRDLEEQAGKILLQGLTALPELSAEQLEAYPSAA